MVHCTAFAPCIFRSLLLKSPKNSWLFLIFFANAHIKKEFKRNFITSQSNFRKPKKIFIQRVLNYFLDIIIFLKDFRDPLGPDFFYSAIKIRKKLSWNSFLTKLLGNVTKDLRVEIAPSKFKAMLYVYRGIV